MGIGTSDIILHGNISQYETWSGFVPIIGDIIVDNGATLLIQPDCNIKFKADRDYQNMGQYLNKTEIIVNGYLAINGWQYGRVSIESIITNPDNGDWGGIYVGQGGIATILGSDIKHAMMGIHAENAVDIEISNCLIEETYYDAIDIVNTPAFIENNVINNNFYNVYQDGIIIDGNAPVHIIGNTISGNLSFGIQSFCSGTIEIRKNVVVNNLDGMYIECPESQVTNIENNTIANNFGTGYSAGLWIDPPPDQSLISVRNNIIAFNNGVGLWNGSAYYTLPADYNDVFDNSLGNYENTIPGEHDISANPLFDENYHLTWANFPVEDETKSPCIDAGHPDLDGDGITWENDPDDQDPDGTRMDIGAFYFDYPPSAPQNLVLTGEVGDYPLLIWDPNPEYDISHYDVWRYYIDINTDGILIAETMNNYYEDTDFIISYVEEDENGNMLIAMEYPVPGGDNIRVYYRVRAVDIVENISDYSNEVHTYHWIPGSPWKVSSPDNTLFMLPEEYALHGNYPNPFNAVTTIRYDLPEDSFVVLKIYDLMGREIRILINFKQAAGFKTILWDGKDNYGNKVSSGVYIYFLSAKSIESNKQFHKTMNMVLLR